MLRVSKRYIRTIIYILLLLGIPFLVHNFIIIPIRNNSIVIGPSLLSNQQISAFQQNANSGDRTKFKSFKNPESQEELTETEHKKSPETQEDNYFSYLSDAIWKKINQFSLWNYNLNSKIVVDIKVTSCYYSPFGEYCPYLNIKPTPKVYKNKKKYLLEKKLLKKDINESKAFRWFGQSKYFVITYMKLEDILESMEETPTHVISAISTNKTDMEKYDLVSKVKIDNHNQLYLGKTKFTATEMKKHNIISDFDILFGEDCVEPRKNWVLTKSQSIGKHLYPSFFSVKKLTEDESFESSNEYLTTNDNELSYEQHLNMKMDSFDESYKDKLTLNSDGNFKILQIADLHFSVGKGVCRDEFPVSEEECEADVKTLKFINKVLDSENPDMVVFTGDQIMGDLCKQDSMSALLKVVDPIIKRKIPYAMIWGNHDDEGSLSRCELSQFVSRLPYSMFTMNELDTETNSFGVGNYVHQIYTKNGNPAVTLYFMDSHKYTKQPKVYPGYDWIKEEQWDYMVKYYNGKIKPSLQSYSRIPLSLAFFHIPLPEYLNLSSKKQPGVQNKVVGSWKEGCTAPKYNSNGVDALIAMDVQVASCGHDHCNDYCLLDDSSDKRDIWLCYGGGSGEGGYGGYGGTERRVRVFNIDTMKGNIYSWKLLNGSPTVRFDEQMLVNGGIPV